MKNNKKLIIYFIKTYIAYLRNLNFSSNIIRNFKSKIKKSPKGDFFIYLGIFYDIS